MRKAFFLTYFYFLLSFTGSAQQLFTPRPQPPDHAMEPISGSTLLFNGWVKAKVVSHNTVLYNDSLLFNFDKQSQKLLATLDGEKVYQFDKREFKSVVFFYGDTSITFEHVSAINERDLFFVIVKTPDKYSLYKYIHIEIRNNSYVQWDTYYVLFPFPNAKFLRLNIVEKKLIERAFALSGDIQKIETFYSVHKGDVTKELFLKHLVEYLNE